jgi:hypothetical protein
MASGSAPGGRAIDAPIPALWTAESIGCNHEKHELRERGRSTRRFRVFRGGQIEPQFAVDPRPLELTTCDLKFCNPERLRPLGSAVAIERPVGVFRLARSLEILPDFVRFRGEMPGHEVGLLALPDRNSPTEVSPEHHPRTPPLNECHWSSPPFVADVPDAVGSGPEINRLHFA